MHILSWLNLAVATKRCNMTFDNLNFLLGYRTHIAAGTDEMKDLRVLKKLEYKSLLPVGNAVCDRVIENNFCLFTTNNVRNGIRFVQGIHKALHKQELTFGNIVAKYQIEFFIDISVLPKNEDVATKMMNRPEKRQRSEEATPQPNKKQALPPSPLSTVISAAVKRKHNDSEPLSQKQNACAAPPKKRGRPAIKKPVEVDSLFVVDTMPLNPTEHFDNVEAAVEMVVVEAVAELPVVEAVAERPVVEAVAELPVVEAVAELTVVEAAVDMVVVEAAADMPIESAVLPVVEAAEVSAEVLPVVEAAEVLPVVEPTLLFNADVVIPMDVAADLPAVNKQDEVQILRAQLKAAQAEKYEWETQSEFSQSQYQACKRELVLARLEMDVLARQSLAFEIMVRVAKKMDGADIGMEHGKLTQMKEETVNWLSTCHHIATNIFEEILSANAEPSDKTMEDYMAFAMSEYFKYQSTLLQHGSNSSLQKDLHDSKYYGHNKLFFLSAALGLGTDCLPLVQKVSKCADMKEAAEQLKAILGDTIQLSKQSVTATWPALGNYKKIEISAMTTRKRRGDRESLLMTAFGAD